MSVVTEMTKDSNQIWYGGLLYWSIISHKYNSPLKAMQANNLHYIVLIKKAF